MSEVPDPLFAEAKIIPFPVHKVRQELGTYDRFAPVSYTGGGPLNNDAKLVVIEKREENTAHHTPDEPRS